MDVPAKMAAIVVKADGRASPTVSAALDTYLEYATIKVPKPGKNQVLIRVSMASANPSDVIFIKGHQGRDRIKGRPAGTEGAGVVVAAGSATEAKTLLGRRVAFYSSSTLWGSWAEYAVADASFCTPVHESISETDAAAMMINPVSALAMLDIIRASGSKTYVLAGAGSQVSKLVISAGQEQGLKAISIVRLHYQIPRLRGAGAAIVLNTQAPDYDNSLREVLASEKPRVLLDGITGPISSNIFALMPEDSVWVVYGQLDTNPTTIVEPSQLIMQNKRIQSFYLPTWIRSAGKHREELEAEAQKRFLDGRWTTDVTAVLPLAEAMERLQSELVKPDGKVFIKI